MTALFINIMRHIHYHWRDILIGSFLGLGLAIASYRGAELIPDMIFKKGYMDIWFETDIPRVFEDMTWRESDYGHSQAHPLFQLSAYPLVFAVKNIFALDAVTAVRLVIAAVAFIWIFALFVLVRLLGCCRWDALLLSLLAGASAASVFFFTVPETYSFGSVTILLALIVAALSQHRIVASSWLVAVNAVTLSITTSNWMVGIFVTTVNRRFKEILQILVNAFALVTVIWGAQKFIFPFCDFFLDIANESSQILRPELGGPLYVMQSFFYHSLVMPAIGLIPEPGRPQWPNMHTQLSAAGSGTPWGTVAAILWTPLLVFGLWALGTLKANAKFRLVLGLTLLGQLGLHLIYGTETFLYSLHFIVLLVPLAALGVLTKFRLVVIGLVLVLIPCLLINNIMQFQKAIGYFVGRG